MNGRAFFDSNICIYCFDTDPGRQARALQLVSAGGVISPQVVQETCSVFLRKRGLLPDQVARIVRRLGEYCEVADVSLTTSLYALELMASVKLSWWDALIVAAALEAGCTTLWSEDMQHGLVVQDLMIIRNPFADHV